VHPEIVDVIYWDADVTAHEIYEGDQVQRLAESTKPKGGGGTRVGAMLDYMKAKDIRPDCIIIFTDGYVESDWGGDSWPAPVLWCVSTKGIVAPFGKTLYVPAGD
jgi:predicted metal-dependent peptidase